MRVLILIDEKNFEQGVINLANRRKDFRYVDFNKIKNFIMDYLKNNLQYKDSQLKHLRTYHYTGEYTDKSIKITKNEGKHVIIFGDYSVTAEEMKKYADMFIDIGRFTEEQLDKFTHIYTANKEEENVN